MDPLSLVLDLVLPLLPEPWRVYVRAAVLALFYVVTLASLITANLPAWAFKRWRGLRVFSWLSALAPRDAAGTLKLPGRAPHDPGALADLAAFRAAAGRVVDQVAPLVPATDPAAPRETQAPPPPSGQSGRASVGALLVLSGIVILVTMVGAVLTGCPQVRELVMGATTGVPDPTPCVVDTHRCNGAIPEVCSRSNGERTRWWPSLALRADGTQRTCAGGCALDDAGVAGCLAVADAASDAGASDIARGRVEP